VENNELYVEEWVEAINDIFAETMPPASAPGESTASTTSTSSSFSCPAGCFGSYSTASSVS
jgi:hypothetical protein